MQTILYGETGLYSGIHALERTLGAMRELDVATTLVEETQASIVGLRDQLAALERHLSHRVADAGVDLDAIERRLFELQSLSRRLRRPVEELVSLEEEIAANLSALDAASLERRRLLREEEAEHSALACTTQALTELRKAAAHRLCAALAAELKSLGFSTEVQVFVHFEPTSIAQGIDEPRPRFFWAPNPGLAPQPLDRIASGGELSRFLLAITGLLAAQRLPTLVFDEIDAGIGGSTLLRVAERLDHLGKRQQILLVTHWPQLARCAIRHFRVEKQVENGVTISKCLQLTDAQRHEELSRMAAQEPL